MSDLSQEKKYSLVPPGEFRCVWMTAGILSYQLCDRDFDCDNCPLDVAMRKHFSDGHPPPHEEHRSTPAEPVALRSDRLYSLNHCWVKHQGENVQQIGLEPFLAAALLRPKAIVFPSVEESVKKDQACMWIVLDGGTLPVDSPLTGTVLSTNGKLKQNPHELFFHPFDEGWLINLRAGSDSEERRQLLTAAEAETFFARHCTLLRELLLQVMRENQPRVGATLPDGGAVLQTVSDIIGPRKYFAMVQRAFQ